VKSLLLDKLTLWIEVKKLLTKRFGDVYVDPMINLMWLQQIGLVVDYHKKFWCNCL